MSLNKVSCYFLRARLIIIALVFLSFFPQTAFADALTTPEKEEALKYSAELLRGVSLSGEQNDVLGISDLDLGSFTLSDSIPAYNINGGDILRAEEDYWLIYQNDTAIATLVSYSNGDETLYRLTSLYASELEQIMKSKKESIVLNYENESYIYSRDDILRPLDTKQHSSNYVRMIKKTSDMEPLLNSFIGCDELKKDAVAFDRPNLSLDSWVNERGQVEVPIFTTEVKQETSNEIHSVQSNVRSSVKSATTTSRLPVPKKQQVSGTCWATSVSSIGEFLTSKQLTSTQICKNLGISLSSGGTDQDALNALELFVYPDSSTSIYGSRVTSALSDQQIKNWINNGVPIYAHLRYSSSTSDHAVVVCGWGQTGSNPMYIFVMNPGTGKEEVLIKPSGGIFQFFYNQKTYKWNYSSIVLTKWQKPYNANGWCYMNSNGTKVTGWKKDDGKWYYFDSNGIMQTGWKKINGQWYYLGTDGAAVTGWKKLNGYWYAFDSNCAMRRGWFKESGSWYYLRTATNTPAGGPEGSMLTSGAWKIGTKRYIFDANGICQNP